MENPSLNGLTMNPSFQTLGFPSFFGSTEGYPPKGGNVLRRPPWAWLFCCWCWVMMSSGGAPGAPGAPDVAMAVRSPDSSAIFLSNLVRNPEMMIVSLLPGETSKRTRFSGDKVMMFTGFLVLGFTVQRWPRSPFWPRLFDFKMVMEQHINSMF